MKRVTVKSGCIMLVKTGLDSQRNGGVTASTSMGNNSGCVGEIPGGSGTTWISAWARKWSIFAGTPVSVAMMMSLVCYQLEKDRAGVCVPQTTS